MRLKVLAGLCSLAFLMALGGCVTEQVRNDNDSFVSEQEAELSDLRKPVLQPYRKSTGQRKTYLLGSGQWQRNISWVGAGRVRQSSTPPVLGTNTEGSTRLWAQDQRALSDSTGQYVRRSYGGPLSSPADSAGEH